MIFNIVTYKQVNKKKEKKLLSFIMFCNIINQRSLLLLAHYSNGFIYFYSQTSGVPSRFAVLKDVPQPHDAMAFGLSIVKPPPISDCL